MLLNLHHPVPLFSSWRRDIRLGFQTMNHFFNRIFEKHLITGEEGWAVVAVRTFVVIAQIFVQTGSTNCATTIKPTSYKRRLGLHPLFSQKPVLALSLWCDQQKEIISNSKQMKFGDIELLWKNNRKPMSAELILVVQRLDLYARGHGESLSSDQ